jgi:preprotein translocase subunit SecG
MESIIIAVHVVLAVGIIGFILIQRGKGADAGASFGGGASQTVFGSEGSSNFLSRTTAILATLFFSTSLALAFYAKQKADNVMDLGLVPAVIEQQSAPVIADTLPVVEPGVPNIQ